MIILCYADTSVVNLTASDANGHPSRAGVKELGKCHDTCRRMQHRAFSDTAESVKLLIWSENRN